MRKNRVVLLYKSIYASPHRHVYILSLILLIAIFFRFYNTPLRYTLGIDSTRDAMVAMEGARMLQLPLTGPFSSLGPFTFGPWYYYQLILFTFITRLAYAPWIFMGVMSVLFVYVMYKTGELLYGREFGLLVSYFSAILPSLISTGVELSNPNLVSIYAGLSVFYFLLLLGKRSSYKRSFLLGVFLGIGINNHYQMSGLLILPLLFLLINPGNYRKFLTILGGIGITFIPLTLFDLNNHWYTVRNMFYYYTVGKNNIYVPNRWLFYVRDFWPSFWTYIFGVPKLLGIVSLLLSVGMVSVFFIKRKLDQSIFLLFIAFAANFILLRYYWGERGYSYLQFLVPFMLIFMCFTIWNFRLLKNGKYFIFSCVILLTYFILPHSFEQLEISFFNRLIRNQADLVNRIYPNKKVVIYNCKDTYKLRAQALAVVLDIEGKLGNSGLKIGLTDENCYLPRNTYVNDTVEATIAAQLLDKMYPKYKNFSYDFSMATEEARLHDGWNPITPNRVFNSTVRWWFEEQP